MDQRLQMLRLQDPEAWLVQAVRAGLYTEYDEPLGPVFWLGQPCITEGCSNERAYSDCQHCEDCFGTNADQYVGDHIIGLATSSGLIAHRADSICLDCTYVRPDA